MAAPVNEYNSQYLSAEIIHYSDLYYHRLVLSVLAFHVIGITQSIPFVPGFFCSP